MTPLSTKGVNKSQLTDRQRLFVVEYMIDLNATGAAKRAGYKSANVVSVQLMRNPLIRRAIGAIQQQTIKKKVIEREGVLGKLHDNLYRDLTDLCDKNGIIHCKLTEIPKRAHAYIAGFEVYQNFDKEGNVRGQTIKIKLCSPDAAQDMAMKHIGAYAPVEEKHTHSMDWDSLYGPPQEKVIDPVEWRIMNPKAKHSDQKYGDPTAPDIDTNKALKELIEEEES